MPDMVTNDGVNSFQNFSGVGQIGTPGSLKFLNTPEHMGGGGKQWREIFITNWMG